MRVDCYDFLLSDFGQLQLSPMVGCASAYLNALRWRNHVLSVHEVITGSNAIVN